MDLNGVRIPQKGAATEKATLFVITSLTSLASGTPSRTSSADRRTRYCWYRCRRFLLYLIAWAGGRLALPAVFLLNLSPSLGCFSGGKIITTIFLNRHWRPFCGIQKNIGGKLHLSGPEPEWPLTPKAGYGSSQQPQWNYMIQFGLSGFNAVLMWPSCNEVAEGRRNGTWRCSVWIVCLSALHKHQVPKISETILNDHTSCWIKRGPFLSANPHTRCTYFFIALQEGKKR